MIRVVLIVAGAAAVFAQPKVPAPSDPSGKLLILNDISLLEAIVQAYHVAPQQVVGPAWLAERSMDISINLPSGMPGDKATPMLRSFLAERFRLASHREQRMINVYVLKAAPGGAHLDQTAAWDKREPDCARKADWLCNGISMPELAWRLRQMELD